MIKETVETTFWQLGQSRFNYPAPHDQIEKDGLIPRVIGMPAPLRDYLRAVHDDSEGDSVRGVAGVVGSGVMVGGVALIGARNNLRFYLFPRHGDVFPHEIPAREPVGEGVNLTRVVVKQYPGAWSLSTMIEQETDIPLASAISYGLDIIRAVKENPGMELRAVNYRGQTAKINIHVQSLDPH